MESNYFEDDLLLNGEKEMVITNPNPFFVYWRGSDNRFLKTKELFERFDQLNIVCLSDEFERTKENMDRIKLFYDKNSTLDELTSGKNLIKTIQVPIPMINISNMRLGLLVIPADVMNKLFDSKSEFDSDQLVVLMLNTTVSHVTRWLKLFRSNSEKTIQKLINHKFFSNYYQLNDGASNRQTIQLINKLTEDNFWANPDNCQFDIAKIFVNRKFNLPEFSSNDNSKNVLDRLKRFFRDFEITSVARSDGYDAYDSEQYQNRFRKFTNPSQVKSNYRAIQSNDLTLTKTDVENLLLTNLLSEKEKYFVLCVLVSHHKYCHYVLNNKKILIGCKGIFEKYKVAFNYLIGYGWLSLYMEEGIAKFKISEDDRFVFDIDTAANLPLFPFDQSNPHQNPYFPVLLDKRLVNLNNTCGGVQQQESDQQGIVDLERFKSRLNLFISGSKTVDLLRGMNWSHKAITGGVMSAILPKMNPLVHIFKKNKTSRLSRYFDEYHSESDVDIACNHSTYLEFLADVIHVREILSQNLGVGISEIKAIPNKSIAMFINEDVVKYKCEAKIIPFDFNYVKNNMDKRDVRYFFYGEYLKEKININQLNTKILGSKINNEIFSQVMEVVPIEKMTAFLVNKTKSEFESRQINDEENDVKWKFDIRDRNTNYIHVVETIKIKITSTHLRHPFEMFKIREKEFFGTIHRFHLPCVRAYYNGTNCFMLPSAITAYQTLTNIDFLYFNGKKDPLNIIDKYRKRGYSVLLNPIELKQFVIYVTENDTYQKAYHLSYDKSSENKIQVSKAIYKIVGLKEINSKYFKPRKYLDQMPTALLPYETTKKKYNYQITNVNSKLSNVIELTSINSSGHINPMKPWIIEAIYDNLN